MTLERGVHSIRTSLWFVPVACVVAGATLSFVSIAIDQRAGYDLVPTRFAGGPEAALNILSTVAIAMVTLTALVLTITMVVVQLAMGQFSPRIVQTFLQDRPSQLAIGLFVATFAHAMLAMREVRFEEPVTVPGLAIVVAYVLVVVSIVVLVLYVHHIGQSLRVSALVELVGCRTRRLIEVSYPDEGPTALDPFVVSSADSGVINRIDVDGIVALAARQGCVVEMCMRLGEFVPTGAPLFRLSEPVAGQLAAPLSEQVILGPERTLEHDVAYGFRMLVDVAERSIAESPFLDPTTAVQAIDRIHDCLRQVAARPISTGEICDEEGTIRLRILVFGWDDYVHLAFDELVIAGRRSPPVKRRLREALLDLRSAALPDRRAPLDLALLALSTDAPESDRVATASLT